MKEIKVIASKSDAHRTLICAALAELTGGGRCEIICGADSDDIRATKACLTALLAGDENMACGESGSTLRFLLPVMGALGRRAVFYPEGRLPERPLSPLYEELESHGCALSPKGSAPLTIEGQLKPGFYRIPGNVSSQYISGLLFALPLLSGGSRIQIEGKLESRPYVEMTLQVLQQFGIRILEEADGFTIAGGQQYTAPPQYEVEGDWSNGCFWLAAGALQPESVCVKGLNPDSLQGDKEILNLLKRFGAKVEACEEGGITVSAGNLWGIDIDAAQIPDMVPALSVLACRARGKTTIRNAGRLRIKESDRLTAAARVLNGLGASVEELADGLIIKGKGADGLKGGAADSFGDHRIAMMAAVASLICKDKVTLTGADAVNKSYPDFFQRLKELGLDDNLATERK